jgi:hypothetical protein
MSIRNFTMTIHFYMLNKVGFLLATFGFMCRGWQVGWFH